MKLILILLSILIIPGAMIGLGDSFLLLLNIPVIFYPVLIGFVIATILYYAVLRSHYAIQNFEHELTHAIVALAFFRRIDSFVSTSRGGYISHSGGFGGPVGSVLITLGPYYLPTFTMILALFRPLVPFPWFPWYDGVIGCTFGYHTVSTVDEIVRNYSKRWFNYVGTNKPTQTDIGKTGLITSAFIIIALTSLLHGIVLYLLTGGYHAVGQYFVLVYEKGWCLCVLFFENVLLPIISWLDIMGR
jgi:hypothetical protein